MGCCESEKCPNCGTKGTPIVYGYPTYEAFENEQKGEIILGGCCITPNSPTKVCKNCGKEWGKWKH